MNEGRFEVFRRDNGEPGARNIDVIELVFGDEGALVVDGVYTGPAAEACWGDWDYEFQLRIPPDHVRAFIAGVFRESFTLERALTFADLQRICQEEAIPAEHWSWV